MFGTLDNPMLQTQFSGNKKKYSKKFGKIHRKTPVPESIF